MANNIGPVGPTGLKPDFQMDENLLKNLQSPIMQPHLSDSFYESERKMQEVTKQISQQRHEQVQREQENNEEIKNIGKLISAIEKSNKGNDKLSRRMFWLTFATATLAVIQIVIAIISLVKPS